MRPLEIEIDVDDLSFYQVSADDVDSTELYIR